MHENECCIICQREINGTQCFFTAFKSLLTARFTIQLNSVVKRQLKLKLEDSKATICAVFLIVW